MKGYVSYMQQLKGCMVEGYVMEVSMGFIMEYMQNFWTVTWRVWDAEEEERVNGEVLEGPNSQVILDLIEWDLAH